jgi:hypothetical protein
MEDDFNPDDIQTLENQPLFENLTLIQSRGNSYAINTKTLEVLKEIEGEVIIHFVFGKENSLWTQLTDCTRNVYIYSQRVSQIKMCIWLQI